MSFFKLNYLSMKRSKIYIVLSLLCVALVMGGCVKKAVDNLFDCTTAASELSTAEYNYEDDATAANCEAYHEAIRKYLDECDDVNADVRADYEDELEEDCSK